MQLVSVDSIQTTACQTSSKQATKKEKSHNTKGTVTALDIQSPSTQLCFDYIANVIAS
jgi:hypothetical protein